MLKIVPAFRQAFSTVQPSVIEVIASSVVERVGAEARVDVAGQVTLEADLVAGRVLVA
jgi:hypothetical protein